MGWLFSSQWDTRKELISDLTQTETNEERTRTCLAHCLRGNVLWTVWEISYPDEKIDRRYIGCDLVQNGGKREGWGYKDMDESCGPFYYTCPPKYLVMVPEVANQEWRDKVLHRHSIKTMPIKIGQVVGLQYCSTNYLKVQALLSAGAIRGVTRGGTVFVARRKHFSGEVLECWPEVM